MPPSRSKEHAQRMARARWDRMTPEERSAAAHERILTASVNQVEKRAGELTDDQVERIICALAAESEAQ